MPVISIPAALAFATILCIVEIPKMLNGKLIRELVTFSVLLALGTLLVILKSLDVTIPNPSDFVIWVYKPISNILKSLLQ